MTARRPWISERAGRGRDVCHGGISGNGPILVFLRQIESRSGDASRTASWPAQWHSPQNAFHAENHPMNPPSWPGETSDAAFGVELSCRQVLGTGTTVLDIIIRDGKHRLSLDASRRWANCGPCPCRLAGKEADAALSTCGIVWRGSVVPTQSLGVHARCSEELL